MTFAKLYKNHANADLIQEAETQGIGIGVKSERSRIIKLLEEHKGTYLTEEVMYCCDGGAEFHHAIALIKGENK